MDEEEGGGRITSVPHDVQMSRQEREEKMS